MKHLREALLVTLDGFPDDIKVVAPTERVAQDEYYREILTSKICVSPFGYGEICWRDFEAILCGCLVIKPDMSHIKTCPDIFIPYKTYIPVEWDYSDLEAQCRSILGNDDLRNQIVENAKRKLFDFYENEIFVDIVAGLLSKVERA